MPPRNILFVLLGALVLLVLTNSLYVIKETERGVLLKFGEVVNADLKPGLHWKVPFVNNVRKLLVVPPRSISVRADLIPFNIAATSDVSAKNTATGYNAPNANHAA